MKLAKTPIQKWMQYCFLSLLFLVVACNVSEPVIDEPPTATAVSANDATEDVTHTDDARTDVATTTRAALESALIARFTPEASFMAVAAALERGYAYPQLEAGILAQRLQENGWIQTEASSMLTPELEPAGVLDLSELSSITGRTRRFRLAAHAAAQNETVALTQFLAGIQNLSEPIATDEITTTDGDFRFTMIVIILGQTGYSLEQIVEALLFGMEFVSHPSCGYLIDNDGTALVPAYNYKDPFDDTDCYVSTPAPSDDEAAEVDNETAPIPADDNPADGPDGAVRLLTFEPILNGCNADDAGDYYVVTCNYALDVVVEYEVALPPGYVTCQAQRFGISGIGAVELQAYAGEAVVTIPDLDVIAQYEKSGDNPSPEEDGQYYSLSCWVGPGQSRDGAWDTFKCLDPAIVERDCVAPWLDLSAGH